jgi:hypothetical protein
MVGVDNRTFLLIEKLIGEPVIEYIGRHRDDERTWDWIARDLSAKVGVTYSREWLRRSFNEATAALGEAPAGRVA